MGKSIAIIGEKDFVDGFRGLGIDVFAIEDIKNPQQVLEKLVKEKKPIIYITETYAKDFINFIEDLNKTSISSIVVIPGVGVDTKLGEKRLRNIIRKAVGTDTINSK